MINELRLSHLISSWRDMAQHYENGIYEEKLSPEARAAVASSFRDLASMLEQATQLCAVCGGDGSERVAADPEYDIEEGRVSCSMCKGTGRWPYSFSCSGCGRDERTEFRHFLTETHPGMEFCFMCYRMVDLGMDPFQRLEPPFCPVDSD